MTLNSSPYFGKPRYCVIAVYKRPIECGNSTQSAASILLPQPLPPHRADEIAEAVDREKSGALERRHEEAARHVRAVMLDAVHLRANRRLPRRRWTLGQRRLDVAEASTHWSAGREQSRAAGPCESANISLL